MPARSEPLLWVQLIGVGVFPLEALLLLLLLGGSDPGPVPGLERLLCWALGALAPTLVLWHRPADVWSVLLLQTPLRARRPLQQRLSRLQDNLGLRLGLVVGGVISLPLLWWLDDHAAIASSLSPLQGTPRLVVLLLAALLLALMLWQWQQLLQALWLLSRPPEVVAAVRPMPQAELEETRLSLGLPLLLLDPLQIDAVPAAVGAPGAASAASTPEAAPVPPAAPSTAALVTDSQAVTDGGPQPLDASASSPVQPPTEMLSAEVALTAAEPADASVASRAEPLADVPARTPAAPALVNPSVDVVKDAPAPIKFAAQPAAVSGIGEAPDFSIDTEAVTIDETAESSPAADVVEDEAGDVAESEEETVAPSQPGLTPSGEPPAAPGDSGAS